MECPAPQTTVRHSGVLNPGTAGPHRQSVVCLHGLSTDLNRKRVLVRVQGPHVRNASDPMDRRMT